MARDRQRAKQRKARRAGYPQAGPPPSQPHRENVPGPLDHASGDVDRAEAAIVGAGDDAIDDDGFDGDDAELEREAVGAAVPGHRAEPPGAPTRRGPGRFAGFLRACVAELQRVQWPDRRQVAQATAVVLGFVVIAGAYLGVADWVAQRIVNFVI